MKRYYILFEGRVQQVGFRSFVAMIAIRHQLTGTVQNLDNGMVSCYLQGKQENINHTLDIILKGNQFIHVTNYRLKEVPFQKQEHKFVILY